MAANAFTLVAQDKAGNVSSPFQVSFVVYSGPTATTTPIPDQNATLGTSGNVVLPTIDLARTTSPFFQYTAPNTTVQYNTNNGSIGVQLFDNIAPKTVANFLNFANAAGPTNTYTDSFFTRLVSNFVLQGGGITYNPANNTFTQISGTAIPGENTLPARHAEHGRHDRHGTVHERGW